MTRRHRRRSAGNLRIPARWLALAAMTILACSAPTRKPLSAPASRSLPTLRHFEGTPTFRSFEFLGEAVIAAQSSLGGVPVGGLSSLTYDSERDLYYAVSDDPASRGPARFYTLDIDLSHGSLDSAKVEVVSFTELLDRNGESFSPMTLDLEGVTLTPERTLYVSSEGQVKQGVAPFLREYRLDGTYVRDFPVPKKFLPEGNEASGIRHNLGFESVTFDSERDWFYTASENALAQDGPKSDLDVASPSRLLRLDRTSGRPLAEYVYRVEPVRDAPVREGDFRTRGLVELIALEDSHLLALERAYTQGVGNRIELFLVSLEGATDVRKWPSLEGREYRPVAKTRLLPLESLGLELDNLEGVALGPRLPDGRRSLILVADNNFSSGQRSQILAFALGDRNLDASLIQGEGHRSPLEGAWVRDVPGTVTSPAARGRGFWMQGEGDQNDSTSDALFVVPALEVSVVPGDVVLVDGMVRETGFGRNLTVTSLEDARVEVVGGAAPLPRPVAIAMAEDRAAGTATDEVERRTLPRQIDDDQLESFEPNADAIDFFESLEGMRVEISDLVVVGATTRFGEFAVATSDSAGTDGVHSPPGGLVATATNTPLPLLVVTRPGTEAPQVAVGDHFEGAISGVLDYAFGTFRILAEDLPNPSMRSREPAHPSLAPSDDALVLATYNVENLSARSGPDKFGRVANSIARSLSSPDIVALQEIQDDTGPEDDGTVSADHTLELLVEAIHAAGGAHYRFAVIDPVDLADGGQPGANIRVAYLYRPDRVRFVPRGLPQASPAAEWLVDQRGPFLSPNPARVNPEHPAFSDDPDRNSSGSRKPLAAEFEFDGQRLFLINVHLRSKRGDSPILGSLQPPERPTEALRSAEARVVRAFVDRLLELDPAAAAIVLGDFNEHPYREPVMLLAASDLYNLVERVPPELRYTYVFRGVSQVLDNVLVTKRLAEDGAARVEIIHSNVDLPSANRASDHDPILVRLHIRQR